MYLLKKRLTAVLLAANACILTFHVSGWSYPNLKFLLPWSNSKSVIRERPAPREPVEIQAPYVNGRAAAFGEVLEGDPDWIKKLTFKVKNKSKTPITFARIDITFPETTATGSKMLHQIFIGRRTDGPSTRDNPPLYLMPNEAVDVSLDLQFGQIERLVKLRYPSVNSISKIAVGLGEVMFADETLYSGGALHKRNLTPESPRGWVAVADKESTHLGN